MIEASDFTITNFGLHYFDGLNDEESRALGDWHLLLLGEIEKLMFANDIFYQLTTPQFFNETGGVYVSKTSLAGGCVNSTSRHPLNAIELRVFDAHRLTNVLDPFPILMDAGDFLSHKRGDCTHFCWAPMIWEPLLIQLFEAILRKIGPRTGAKEFFKILTY